jgi:hypothetical protein
MFEAPYISHIGTTFAMLPVAAPLKLRKEKEASREFIDPLIKYRWCCLLFLPSLP